MDSIRAGPSADRAPSPVDLVRYCRQQIETPVPVMGKPYLVILKGYGLVLWFSRCSASDLADLGKWTAADGTSGRYVGGASIATFGLVDG